MGVLYLSNCEDAIKWIQSTGKPNFCVTTTAKADNNMFFQSDPEDEIDIKFQKFRDACSVGSGENLIIYTYDIWDNSHSRFGGNNVRFNFTNKQQQQQPKATGMGWIGAPEGFISQSESDAKMNALFMQKENQELKDRVNELTSQNKDLQSPFKEFLRGIAPLAPQIISGILGKRVAAVGTLDNSDPVTYEKTEEAPVRRRGRPRKETIQEAEAEEIKEPVNEKVEALKASLKKWEANDPDFVTLIQKIALLAESNKNLYNMAKDMLIKQNV